MANRYTTSNFVLQAAKLYHEEQSLVTETMSLYLVIFVINLLILLVSPLKNEFDHVL